jgi:argininosuccinate lyase
VKRGAQTRGTRAMTLWSGAAALDAHMLRYTVADDRVWDARLMPWDILGSIGHVEGLRRAGLLSENEHRRLVGALRGALKAAERGELAIAPEHEDVHSAVELWLTERLGALGERVHTGRSRNDQVTVDLRLFLKHRVLDLHAMATTLVGELLAFARRHQRVLWPGYTHQRRAMPSSAGLWAAGYANGLLDTIETLDGLWPRLDRSPLGSAAGYGVPLPLSREAVARALGFGGVDHAVTGVQNARGKLEAAVLFWCTELGHDLAKFSTDVILFSSEEFGWLVLPTELSTGSSIMPQKRNPDLFELTRARTALVEGDLAQVMGLKGKLAGGYHRDFQFLKAPLVRGLDTTGEMLAMLASALPRLGVDRERARLALSGDILATDEVMRRVRGGEPFRRVYRELAEAVKRGEATPRPSDADLAEARRSTGGIGNLGLAALQSRLRAVARWQRAERVRFDRAMRRLARGR